MAARISDAAGGLPKPGELRTWPREKLCAVTARWSMRFRSWASTRNTYRFWNRIVGTVKKSADTMLLT